MPSTQEALRTMNSSAEKAAMDVHFSTQTACPAQTFTQSAVAVRPLTPHLLCKPSKYSAFPCSLAPCHHTHPPSKKTKASNIISEAASKVHSPPNSPHKADGLSLQVTHTHTHTHTHEEDEGERQQLQEGVKHMEPPSSPPPHPSLPPHHTRGQQVDCGKWRDVLQYSCQLLEATSLTSTQVATYNIGGQMLNDTCQLESMTFGIPTIQNPSHQHTRLQLVS